LEDLTNKDIYASVKKPSKIEKIRVNRLRWFGHVQRMEENRIPKRLLYMNLGTTSLRGRPTNRWQDEVREDGRIVGAEGWQQEVHNREEWKKLLRWARNRRILHMPIKQMNDYRHSPPYATDTFQKVRCKSQLRIHMANYLCKHKSVLMKYLPNYTQQNLIPPCTLLLSQL